MSRTAGSSATSNSSWAKWALPANGTAVAPSATRTSGLSDLGLSAESFRGSGISGEKSGAQSSSDRDHISAVVLRLFNEISEQRKWREGFESRFSCFKASLDKDSKGTEDAMQVIRVDIKDAGDKLVKGIDDRLIIETQKMQEHSRRTEAAFHNLASRIEDGLPEGMKAKALCETLHSAGDELSSKQHRPVVIFWPGADAQPASDAQPSPRGSDSARGGQRHEGPRRQPQQQQPRGSGHHQCVTGSATTVAPPLPCDVPTSPWVRLRDA